MKPSEYRKKVVVRHAKAKAKRRLRLAEGVRVAHGGSRRVHKQANYKGNRHCDMGASWRKGGPRGRHS